ncbi:hypothetical protein [Limimaricola pyoseonensis]|uniref:Yip1 domain-containing protein n=1 Tax=Limimaricola pyoseonensis TaxID=521013 RepID=A0A1G7ALZ6_9RHOB|nr:hypothetical protein [Limimaricola pyoseonensis]SDE15879.1 hypothetical protein SAMN04488567_1027 [Limimaricola pyoseonensis]
MAVSSDILRTWRAPRQVVSDLAAEGRREDKAVGWLFVACGLIFVAQWPRLARVAFETQAEVAQLMAYELLAWIFVWPLFFYVLAGASWLVLKVFRAGVTAFEARLSLFWAFLAATPAGLLYGLQSGLNGPGLATSAVGAVWIAAFFLFWAQGLRAVIARKD